MKLIAGAILILAGAILVSAAFIADAIMHNGHQTPRDTNPLMNAGGFATCIGFLFLCISLFNEAVDRKHKEKPKE